MCSSETPPGLEPGSTVPPIGTTRTATILFADLVASTDTRTRIGDPAADWQWLAIEHELVGAVAHADGRVVKTVGDGLIAAFESAAAALESAVEAMRSAGHGRLRIGVAVGDVAVVRHDMFGTPVVVAARLCSSAQPGQILVTSLVLAIAGTRAVVRPDWSGFLELKGLPNPVSAMSIPWCSDAESPDDLAIDLESDSLPVALG